MAVTCIDAEFSTCFLIDNKRTLFLSSPPTCRSLGSSVLMCIFVTPTLFPRARSDLLSHVCIILGAGYDYVDVHACSARVPPIRVSNVPTAVDDATADVNMFLIIGTLRNFNTGMQALREGKWRGRPPPPLGHDLEGKILGILGMGGIGRNLKAKAEAFSMRIIYHNRRRLSDELSAGARYVSFDELLQTSDVISLNLPLNVRHPCCGLPLQSTT
jgi:lactate dehydrogenase-like 2-hydroxyacid dehydrogenase